MAWKGKGATLESANDDDETISSTGTMVARLLLSLVALGLLVLSVAATSSDHTNNWAVLVCSSRFWSVPFPPAPFDRADAPRDAFLRFNYRVHLPQLHDSARLTDLSSLVSRSTWPTPSGCMFCACAQLVS